MNSHAEAVGEGCCLWWLGQAGLGWAFRSFPSRAGRTCCHWAIRGGWRSSCPTSMFFFFFFFTVFHAHGVRRASAALGQLGLHGGEGLVVFVVERLHGLGLRGLVLGGGAAVGLAQGLERVGHLAGGLRALVHLGGHALTLLDALLLLSQGQASSSFPPDVAVARARSSAPR